MVASEQPADDTAPQKKQEQEQTEPQHLQHSWGAPEVKPEEVVESLEGDESEKGSNEHRDQMQRFLSAVHSTAPPLKFCPEVCIVLTLTLIFILIDSKDFVHRRLCLVQYTHVPFTNGVFNFLRWQCFLLVGCGRRHTSGMRQADAQSKKKGDS